MSTQAPVIVTGLTLATILQTNIMGVTVDQVAIATGIAFVGILGKTGFMIASAAEANGAVNIGAVLGMLFGSLISAPAIVLIYLTILKMAGIQSDTITLLGLIFLGIIGAKALPWLYNTGTGLINKKTGLNFPSFGVTGAKVP